ncbi:hypothetical protein P171DRAFT_348482 [Karstenula rhodostoma CBS 690.94]|uniref:Uncharacterized protein n=1 Tax=Karstenula rhodostoma CBS 690.94 TaxID=1392251 RepID=A0A9P4PUU8_9PLEO|nr:hypothetical protein P171DRAFT_348482 [Karstenula rhodostoma CBS 690.94]
MSNSTPPSPTVDIPATNTVNAQYVTPPSSFIGPPTPPATRERFSQVEHILAYFKDIQSGRRKLCGKHKWIQFWLVDGEFDEIVRRLEEDPDLDGYVKDKVRYDYDHRTRQFVIRMLSDTHETFREALHQEIWKWIKGLAKREDNVGIFARGMADTEGAPSYKFPPTIAPDADYKIGSDATADIDGAQAIHTPDIPFRHEQDALPGTIIEVAYSQKSKELRRLAYTYLVHSNAAVQVVFGFDLKDGSTQRATFSVWRSKDEDDVLSMATQYYNQEFRSTNGEPTSHDPLCFRLQDFAMDDTAKDILGSDDEELFITMDQLCSFLSKAEKKTKNRKEGGLRTKTTCAGKRKLPLEETPERPVTVEDEEEWEHEDARTAKRMNKGDGAYSGPRKPTVVVTRRRSARLGGASQLS